jgi:hypothetical protein
MLDTSNVFRSHISSFDIGQGKMGAGASISRLPVYFVDSRTSVCVRNAFSETDHFYMCCSVHFHNNNSMYPINAHSLLCETLHSFANMFRSRGSIIRAPRTLNISMLLYTIHVSSYTVCGYVTSVLCVLSI